VSLLGGLLTAAALVGTLDVSERTEFRLRYPGLNPEGAAMDLEADPDIRLTLASRSTSLLLEYTPQLAAWDLNETGIQPDYLNRGIARLEWKGRRLRLSLSEAASYGVQSYGSLASTQPVDGSPARVDVFPSIGTFLYESSTSTLEAKWTSGRWLLTGSGGYQLSGGADAVARETLPFQSGPFLVLAENYSVTRRDRAITTASGIDATFSSGVDDALVQLDEGWRHQWSRETFSLLRGGIAEGATRGLSASDALEGPGAPYRFATEPVAMATLQRDFVGRVNTGEVNVTASLGPTINPIGAFLDERVGVSTAGHYERGRVGLRGQITLSESVPTSELTGVRIFYTEIASSYRVSRAVTLEIGARSLWQAPTASAAVLAEAPRDDLYVPVTVFQEVIFAAVVLQASTIHF
jgi:hypothetical protein